MASFATKRVYVVNPPSEEVEDQIERLNGVIQNLMVNMDMSATNQFSLNNLSSSYFKNTFSNSDSEPESIEDKIDRKFEEMLLENDRLSMKIEDLIAHSDRNVSEFCINSEGLKKILNDLKLVLCGRLTIATLNLPGLLLKIRIVDPESKEFPDKGFISDMHKKVNENTLKDKISVLESENYFLNEINSFAEQQHHVLNQMLSQFKILCSDKVDEVYHSQPASHDIMKEAALQVEVKNYITRNKLVDKTQKEVEWQLNETKIVKQHYLNKINELNDYKKNEMEKARSTEANSYNPPLVREQNKRIKKGAELKPEPEFIDETSILHSRLVGGIELSSHELHVPVPSYKNVSIESLQDHLKFLEEKASICTPNEKLLIEIERCKTKITNLRGEQAILDCKNQTKTMFKKFETIEKTVKKENQKRGKLIKQLLRDSNGDSESLKHEIEASLGKSLMKLEEKNILRRRSGNMADKLNEDGYNLAELRTQISSLFKYDEMIRKSLEKQKKKIDAKENELKQREKFLLENWKRNYTAKEIIEIVQKVSEKLMVQKSKLDKDKLKLEEVKKTLFNNRLENDIEKVKLKNLANQIFQEKKYVENEKAEIVKFVKQVSNLPSYLSQCKFLSHNGE